jgi:hypothetical protein
VPALRDDGRRVAFGERAARLAAEAAAAQAIVAASSAQALIAHLRLAIEKMKSELYGSRSEWNSSWKSSKQPRRRTRPWPRWRGTQRATDRCPSEDIGGHWRYGEILEAIANPSHERHAESQN